MLATFTLDRGSAIINFVLRILVVLDTAWGRGGSFFRINPRNHSGNRLIKLIGHDKFLVTNACPQVVRDASRHGTPDPFRLRDCIMKLRPELLLLGGKVAQRTWEQAPLVLADPPAVYPMPHPAARTWSKADILRVQAELQNLQSELSAKRLARCANKR